MKLLSKPLICFAFAAACAACGSGEPVESVPDIPGPPLVPIEQVSAHNELDKEMVGCWTNGRGELLRITPNALVEGFIRKSIKDSPKPVFFDVIEEDRADISLLRLKDRPQFFIFQDYLSLSVLNDEQTEGPQLSDKDFLSYDDYLVGKTSGHGGWVKDECGKFYPKWFEVHYGLN